MAKKHIHNILIPVLCPSESTILLKQAVYFHEIFSSKITFLLVIPKAPFLEKIFNPKKPNSFKEKREAYSNLIQNIKDYFQSEIPNFVDIIIEDGELVTEVQKKLKTKKFDLIIIKECNKIKSLLDKLKAQSEKIISGAECPVMMIHEKWTKTGINEILIPIDITKKCKNAVFWAVEISLRLKAKIMFVSIVNLNIKIENSLVYKRSGLIKKWINKQGIECGFEILKSTPNKMAEVLLTYADKGSADLIMILTHEEFIASNNYLGRFAKQVIHNSPKPVLSIVSHNKPMFKVISGINDFGRKRIEDLNITEHEFAN